MADNLTKLNINPIDWATRDTGFIPTSGEKWFYYNNSSYPNTIIYLIGDGTNTIENLTLYAGMNDQDQNLIGTKTISDGGDNANFPRLKIRRATGGTKTQAGLDLVIGSTGNAVLSPLDGAGAEITSSQLYWDFLNNRWYMQSDFECNKTVYADACTVPFVRSLATTLQLDPNYGTSTGDSIVQVLRNTNTTGARRFRIFKGDGTATTQFEFFADTGNLTIQGVLSKGSGSFNIEHPLKPDTHRLVHSFVEAPYADNIYSGMVTLKAGKAKIDIDKQFNMTKGTFEALNTSFRRVTSNESGFTKVISKLKGAILTIEAEDKNCNEEIFWQVIGERQDKHMLDTAWTDKKGRVIIEPLKDSEPATIKHDTEPKKETKSQ